LSRRVLCDTLALGRGDVLMAMWTRYATDDATTVAGEVEAVLGSLAPDPPPTTPTSSDVGVVVFDRPDDDVLDLVRSSSRGGLVRILAVGTSAAAIDERGPWPFLDAGAADVLVQTDATELSDQLSARLDRWNDIELLLRSPEVEGVLAGRTPTWTTALREIVEVARFSDASVLLTGERGTGKDVVARLIHELDPRPFKRQFVKVDCRSVDPFAERGESLAVDLGAIDGEVSLPGLRQLGSGQLSSGGTLYLDEVGALPAASRAALLRTIEDGIAGAVDDWPGPSVRLICSTTDDPATDGGADDERPWERIASRHHLPPLRDRRDDVPAIAEHLLRRLVPDIGDVGLDPQLALFLTDRAYPANVHDLLTVVRGIAARHVGPGPITVGALPPHERARAAGLDLGWRGDAMEHVVGRAIDAGASLKAIGEAARDVAVRIALEREDGDVRRAAQRLGTTARSVASRTGAPPPPSTAPAAEEEPLPPPPVVAVPDSAVVHAHKSG
jgi:DNA-binding NtrC family response regulator